jgi:hypothetical protein
MSAPKFDTDVGSYSLSELLIILGLDYPDPNSITEKTNDLIQKYKKSDPDISTFFKNVQSQLLQYAADLEDEENSEPAVFPTGENQVKKRYENEYLTQQDKNQVDKITDREQKIKVFGDEHVPMTREQLGVSNTYNVPIAQDKLNPKLENVTTRFINLDSQFRQSTNSGISSSSDYTLDLSDYLPNVLSMTLYSFQIPFCWYVIDEAYGNTCFWITNQGTNVCISISSGNYSPTEFVTNLNNSFSSAGFTFSNTTPVNTPVSYNSNSGKITLKLFGGVYAGNSTNPTFTITTSTIITFFDYTTKLQCPNSDTCVNKGFYINQTLGWVMGFRVPFINVSASGNTASSILDLNGTKYLLLIIDDFNQNHINNGLISITEYSNTLKIPSYYSPDLPYTCSQSISNTTTLSNSYNNYASSDIGLVVADKLNTGLTKYPKILPSAPRVLTQSQIYTINEIIKNNDKTTNFRAKAPTNNDIFAILPVKTSGLQTGSLIVETSGSLQDNKRVYFGPVNIERMRVKLVDDKGNVLNVNGADWTFTLICECLYQY